MAYDLENIILLQYSPHKWISRVRNMRKRGVTLVSNVIIFKNIDISVFTNFGAN